MNEMILALLLCIIILPSISPGLPQANTPPHTIVTAAQVNGTWRNMDGSFKVWALGHQRLKVEFLGVYYYNTPAGRIANTGSANGTAFIEGDTATFKPDGREEGCKITMRFTRGKLVVMQEGDCGFGHKVIADGTYRKMSSRKPKFEEY